MTKELWEKTEADARMGGEYGFWKVSIIKDFFLLYFELNL